MGWVEEGWDGVFERLESNFCWHTLSHHVFIILEPLNDSSERKKSMETLLVG